MKINELQLSKDLQDANLLPKHILSKYGWKLLGWGVFGAVAEHPNFNYVLKLFVNDPSYEKFIKFVNSHPNIHLPKISKNIRKLPGNNEYSYIGLEKLTPTSDNKLDTTYFPEICYLVIMVAKNQIEMSTSTEEMVREQLGIKDLSSVDINSIFSKLKRAPTPSWIKMVNEIIPFSKQNGIDFFDIHTGNFALRKRTLILIDPFSS